VYRTVFEKELAKEPKLLFGEVSEVNFILKKTSGVRQFVASDVDRTCILLKNVSFVWFCFFSFGLLDMDFIFIFSNLIYTIITYRICILYTLHLYTYICWVFYLCYLHNYHYFIDLQLLSNEKIELNYNQYHHESKTQPIGILGV